MAGFRTELHPTNITKRNAGSNLMADDLTDIRPKCDWPKIVGLWLWGSGLTLNLRLRLQRQEAKGISKMGVTTEYSEYTEKGGGTTWNAETTYVSFKFSGGRITTEVLRRRRDLRFFGRMTFCEFLRIFHHKFLGWLLVFNVKLLGSIGWVVLIFLRKRGVGQRLS